MFNETSERSESMFLCEFIPALSNVLRVYRSKVLTQVLTQQGQRCHTEIRGTTLLEFTQPAWWPSRHMTSATLKPRTQSVYSPPVWRKRQERDLHQQELSWQLMVYTYNQTYFLLSNIFSDFPFQAESGSYPCLRTVCHAAKFYLALIASRNVWGLRWSAWWMQQESLTAGFITANFRHFPNWIIHTVTIQFFFGIQTHLQLRRVSNPLSIKMTNIYF